MAHNHREEGCKNIVFVAVRKDGCVGYFKASEEVPENWKPTGSQSITDVMESMRASYEETLRIMNSHWRR